MCHRSDRDNSRDYRKADETVPYNNSGSGTTVHHALRCETVRQVMSRLLFLATQQILSQLASECLKLPFLSLSIGDIKS